MNNLLYNAALHHQKRTKYPIKQITALFDEICERLLVVIFSFHPELVREELIAVAVPIATLECRLVMGELPCTFIIA